MLTVCAGPRKSDGKQLSKQLGTRVSFRIHFNVSTFRKLPLEHRNKRLFGRIFPIIHAAGSLPLFTFILYGGTDLIIILQGVTT